MVKSTFEEDGAAPSAAAPSVSAPPPAPTLSTDQASSNAVPSPALPQPSETVSAELPRDLTPLGMFMSADIIVKAVMLGLIFASVLTWTVWLAKTLELLSARRRLRRAGRLLADAASLDDAAGRRARQAGTWRC